MAGRRGMEEPGTGLGRGRIPGSSATSDTGTYVQCHLAGNAGRQGRDPGSTLAGSLVPGPPSRIAEPVDRAVGRAARPAGGGVGVGRPAGGRHRFSEDPRGSVCTLICSVDCQPVWQHRVGSHTRLSISGVAPEHVRRMPVRWKKTVNRAAYRTLQNPIFIVVSRVSTPPPAGHCPRNSHPLCVRSHFRLKRRGRSDHSRR